MWSLYNLSNIFLKELQLRLLLICVIYSQSYKLTSLWQKLLLLLKPQRALSSQLCPVAITSVICKSMEQISCVNLLLLSRCIWGEFFWLTSWSSPHIIVYQEYLYLWYNSYLFNKLWLCRVLTNSGVWAEPLWIKTIDVDVDVAHTN